MSILDAMGDTREERAACLLAAACEVPPEGCEEDWVLPDGRAEVLARWTQDEPYLLDDALRAARRGMEDGTKVKGRGPRVDFARGVVILSAAKRALHR